LIFFADGDSDVMDSLVDRGQELVSQRLVVMVGLLQKSSELPHSTIPFSPTGNMQVPKRILQLLVKEVFGTIIGVLLHHYCSALQVLVCILINYDYVGARNQFDGVF
jgi:hypothetical protein